MIRKLRLRHGMRRWFGGPILLLGIVMAIYDWKTGSGLMWPNALAWRLIPLGVIVVGIEIGFVISERRKQTDR